MATNMNQLQPATSSSNNNKLVTLFHNSERDVDNDLEHQNPNNSSYAETKEEDLFDYAKRAQWLRAAVLGANDGLISTASLMMGVGAVKADVKAMILTGFAGLVAGACSMAIGEFVSVYSQLDIERAQIKRRQRMANGGATAAAVVVEKEVEDDEEESLPNPFQAAAASALAFSIGAMVPLLAASFIGDYWTRLVVVVVAVTVGLIAFGWLGAVLGRAPSARSALRVLIGGWFAMAVTFGLTKWIGSSGL